MRRVLKAHTHTGAQVANNEAQVINRNHLGNVLFSYIPIRL